MAKRARRTSKGSTGRKRRATPPPPPPSFLADNRRALLAVVFVIAIIIVAAYAVTHLERDGDGNGVPPTQKDPAPEFHLVDVDGRPIHLEEFRGKVVLLDLFATSCNPCHMQMDDLNQLRMAYPESQVVILSVDVDIRETDEDIRAFRDMYHANWLFASDTDNVGTKYDAQSIPTLVIIDQDGNLEWRHVGMTTFHDLQARIEPLL